MSLNVFISGTAATYGEWGDKGPELIEKIVHMLMKNGYMIANGNGPGIGKHIFQTVLNASKYNIFEVDYNMRMYPFPYDMRGADGYDEMLSGYREMIAESSDAVIFLFGNQEGENGIVMNPEMQREFEYAKKAGCMILPIGSTGCAAEKVYAQMLDVVDDCPYLDMADMAVFGKSKDIDEIVDHIENILHLYEDLFRE